MSRHTTLPVLCIIAFSLGLATPFVWDRPNPKPETQSTITVKSGTFNPPKTKPKYEVDTFPTCGWSYQILSDGENFTIQERPPYGYRFWQQVYGFSSTNIVEAYQKVKERVDRNCAKETARKQEEELASKRKTVEIITDNPSEYLK